MPAVAGYAAPSFPPGRPVVEAVADLTTRIFTDFTFDPTFSDVTTPLDEVLGHRRGVCQDFAHLAIDCLRSIGAGRPLRQRLPGDRAAAGPAEAGRGGRLARLVRGVLPGWGWLDLDPTNDQVAPPGHVTVAWGRDYRDVAPVRGVVSAPRRPRSWRWPST